MRVTIEAEGAEISIREAGTQGPPGGTAGMTAPGPAAAAGGEALNAGPAAIPSETAAAQPERLETAAETTAAQGAAGDLDAGEAPASEAAAMGQQEVMTRPGAAEEGMRAETGAGGDAIDAGPPQLPSMGPEGEGGAGNE